MKTTQKQCRAVLVANPETPLRSPGIGIYIAHNTILKDGLPQHLKILSDDEIKEGDYTIWKGQIFKVDSHNAYSYTNNITLKYAQKYCKKIIATTNSELTITQATDNPALQEHIASGYVSSTYQKQLPSISDQFIQQWIDRGCPEIVNVEYEVEESGFGGAVCKAHPDYILKINQDNTINCSFVGETWSDAWSAYQKYVRKTKAQYGEWSYKSFPDFLDENYNSPTRKEIK